MTRIGLIADIHGNAFALDQVLARLDEQHVDEIVCLGDVAVLGPEPDRVVTILRKLGIATVCGNTDAWLIDGIQIPADPPDTATSRAFTDWTKAALTKSSSEWIASLPMVINRTIHGRVVCFCHGSPTSTDDIIVNLNAKRVGEFGCQALIGGHTHQQIRTSIGDVIYVNPGSAGLPGVGPGSGVPIHERPDWVEFAVVEFAANQFDVVMHRLPIDVGKMWATAEHSGMPEQTWWRSLWR